MATLLQHLCDRSNDYSELESEYRRITGAEMVTDPLCSPEKGPQLICKSASVLIGSYNSRESLEKTLYSIEQSSFHQKYAGQLEIVVVDDGSTDGTSDMIHQLSLSVPLKYVRQDHAGLTVAHNTGFAFAEGDILIFSDSDMVHTRYALEELMKRHEVLTNVTLAGFRYDVDPAHPSVSLAAIQNSLGQLLPEFDKDFRLNFPGRPASTVHETRHWKDYGFNRKLLMANGARYDLPAMVVGGFFSMTRADYVRMGGSEERLVGWGYEDSLIGARSIALGNYIIPVYSAASAHLSHPRRLPSEASEFQANIQTMTRILNEEFRQYTAVPDRRQRARNFVYKPPACAAPSSNPHARPDAGMLDSFRRGCFDYSLGKFCASLDHFEAAIRQSPDSPWPRLGKGKALRELGKCPESVETISECLAQNPQNGWAHFELGLTYAASTQYDKARCAIETASKTDPGLFDARWALETSSTDHKRRANFHGGEGFHHLAVRDVDLALTVDSSNAWAHFDRGLSLRSLCRAPEALLAFQAADALLDKKDLNRTWIHTELGKCFADLGVTNQAKQQLETALQLFPENSHARVCLDTLHAQQERRHQVFCPLSLIRSVATIDGWLTDLEAELLIGSVFKAARLSSGGSRFAVVEIGSFCGRSTVTIARTVEALGGGLHFYAIDPHDGYHLAPDRDSYQALLDNLQAHQLQDQVEIIRERSTQVTWEQPIALLFIDGLHDYGSVKADYLHFKDALVHEGLVAFHDYVDYCPGVQKFVNEFLRGDELLFLAQRERLILFQKMR